jgi:K+-transporting ATPase ATPase C chain
VLSLVRSAILMLLTFTALTGFVYPAVVTALAQALFPRQANGSLVFDQQRIAGSSLIGQPFADPRCFWSRPSATPEFAYNAAQSSGSNLGPLSAELRREIDARVKALRASDPANRLPIPADLVTSSASGLDPDISPEAARWQAPRVARRRGIPLAAVERLIDQHVQGRQFAILGEPRVNVGALNRALDALK